MTKAIFLDRDGVINKLVYHQEHGIIDSPFKPEQVELVDGICEAIRAFNDAGYEVIVVSNQPCVSKGHCSYAEWRRIDGRIKELLGDARIDEEYYCFHQDGENCENRKPKPGMLVKAQRDLGIDFGRSWLIGDGITDIQAGKSVGVKTVFLGKEKCEHCGKWDEIGVRPDFVCLSIAEASQLILKETVYKWEIMKGELTDADIHRLVKD